MAGPNRPRVPTDRDYLRFAKGQVAKTRGLTERLASGELGPDGWADAFHLLLVEGHTEAFVLGRQRGGDLTLRTDDDLRFGLDVADGQDEYLQRFLGALKDKSERYYDADGNLKENVVDADARHYVARMRGTANEAFVAAGDPEDEYDWLFGPTEHCDDCLSLHELGPYTAATIISYPGDGQTDCKAHCACRLKRRRDGRVAFSRPDIYLKFAFSA